ncbi:MAG: hypothetical protein IJB96_05805 [Lachnospira sp.]|nr:hypothetical protein [Lachnospira sp.]
MITKKIKGLLEKSYKDIIAVAVLWAVVTALLFGFFELWKCDLSVPIGYGGGDEFSIINTVRIVQESGWNIGTDKLAATEEYYYNNNEIISGLHNADVFLAKVFLFFTGNDTFAAANLVFFSIFYIASLVMYIVMRLLGTKKWISGAGALVYAFLAFVFMRGVGHLSLSSHYFVPFAVLMAIWVYEDERFMMPRKGFFKYKRNIGGLVMAALVATQGIGYWQVFGCFVILVATVSAWAKKPSVKTLIRGAVSIGVIAVAVVVCCIPVFVSMAQAGSMSSAGRARYGGDGEVYALKIIQLFLPVSGHGIDAIQYMLDMYNSKAPLVNENKSAYLGLFGICGFVLLCFWILTSKRQKDTFAKRMTVLSDMNIFSVLLATVGGVGAMFYSVGFKLLRSYNRISVYIACICIIAVCLGIQELQKRIKSKSINVLYMAAVVAFVFFTVWEQNPGYRVDYAGNKATWESDRDFVADIENVMDESDKVFQLPYQSFPESVKQNDMDPLEHLTGFLHSDKLRWTYGTMPESDSDIWYEETAGLTAEDMVVAVSDKGFDGIYINRAGYEKKDWEALETELSEILGVKPIVSKDGRLSFFKIR